MATRRGCVMSLWSGSERVRIGERLKATLAGIIELEMLRYRHRELVAAALTYEGATGPTVPQRQGASGRARNQQMLSPSECLEGMGNSGDSRWSTLSWDSPSDPLSPHTPDAHLDCDSRPSSGFYSVSGSSLSDSCCSVCSDGPPGAPGGSNGVRSSWGPWDCRPAAGHPGETQRGEKRPFSTGDLDISGLLLLSDVCSGLADDSQRPAHSAVAPSPLQLDPRFCSDLVSRKTKEVYPYPSPLHAVALQSPLFAPCQDAPPSSSSPPNPLPATECVPCDGPELETPPAVRPPPRAPSMARLDQYISKLVLQYHSRSSVESSSRTGSRKWYSGHGRGSSQSLTSFDSLSMSSTHAGGAMVQRRATLTKGGSSCRNSINLGNLSSLNGDNPAFHLNLSPNLNADSRLSVKGSSGSCDFLAGDTPTPTPSPSSSSLSAPNAWHGRRRIATSAFGFSRSVDWSSGPQGEEQQKEQEEEHVDAQPVCGGSPEISVDSPRVCEIARVSGLPRSVVAGLLEQGVELDADCFQVETETEGRASRPCPLDPPTVTPSQKNMPCFDGQTSSRLYGTPEVQLMPQTHVAPPLVQATPTSRFDHHLSTLAPSPCRSPSDSRSTPRSPFTPPTLTVFQRSSPSQSSLPRFRMSRSPNSDVRPRGGSLRQASESAWGSGGGAWRKGERLYQGKHVSRELVRASTFTNYATREEDEEEEEAPGEEGQADEGAGASKRRPSFRKRLEGLFVGKERERGGEDADEWKQKMHAERCANNRRRAEGPSKGHNQGALFRSESQGFLERQSPRKESGNRRRQQWVSTLEIAGGGALGGACEDERLSSTASLFHLSRSQSPEGSCHSLSPLSSPSLSPPNPPPTRLTRSRSFRDLGRRVFSSVRPFSFKTQSLRK